MVIDAYMCAGDVTHAPQDGISDVAEVSLSACHIEMAVCCLATVSGVGCSSRWTS